MYSYSISAAISYSPIPGFTAFIAARCASTEASTAFRIKAISPGDFTARIRVRVGRRLRKAAIGARALSFAAAASMKWSSPLSGCGVVSV